MKKVRLVLKNTSGQERLFTIEEGATFDITIDVNMDGRSVPVTLASFEVVDIQGA